VNLTWTYIRLGDTQRRAGLDRDAERSFRQALRRNARLGLSGHLSTGEALWELGFVHNGRGLYGKALRECRRALELFSRELGPTNYNLISPLECMGEALMGSGKFGAARKHLERAFALASESELAPQWTAGLSFQLARALWATPADRPRARELARSTLAALERAEGDNRKLIARIQAWLRSAPISKGG
jgi:tetratricopeptide (TPR) repeat protein